MHSPKRRDMSASLTNQYSAYQNKKAQDPLLLFIPAYLALSIFYVLPSGMPQPADFLLVIGMGLGLLRFILSPIARFPAIYLVALGFGFFTLVINILHYAFLPDTAFLFSGLFYIYNASVFIFISYLMVQSPALFKKSMYWGLIISVFLESIFAFVLQYSDGPRIIGSFNNPNQFSYWALLTTCLVVAHRYPKKFETLDYILIALLGYMIIVGLSKGTFLAFCLVVVYCLASRMIGLSLRYFMLFVATIICTFSIFMLENVYERLTQTQSIYNLSQRLENIGHQSDDSLAGRGYDRIWEHPEYLLVGAGEGGYQRFTTQEFPHPFEMHSGLGNILFSYGIFGFFILCWFLFLIFRKLPAMHWVLLASVMAYGLTHQNMRFSHTWVFFGLCYGVSCQRRYIDTGKDSPQDKQFLEQPAPHFNKQEMKI